MSLLNALKGTTGEYEVQRVLGAIGTLVYIVTAPALVWAGKVTTTLESFCIAYPAGMAVCIGACAGAIALKDRSTATSRVIQQTGGFPTSPPPAADATAQPVNVAEVGGKPV